MPTIRRSIRLAVEEVPAAIVFYLQHGVRPEPTMDGAFELIQANNPRLKGEGLRPYWRVCRPGLLPAWIEQHPGTRPAGWWRFEAPEPARRRLGGTGQLRSDVLSIAPSLDSGIDMNFFDAADAEYYRDDPDVPGTAFDPNDPPTFESQATYLRRHKLLSPEEASQLTAADFEPERIFQRHRDES